MKTYLHAVIEETFFFCLQTGVYPDYPMKTLVH